jgi:hypothetical protein
MLEYTQNGPLVRCDGAQCPSEVCFLVRNKREKVHEAALACCWVSVPQYDLHFCSRVCCNNFAYHVKAAYFEQGRANNIETSRT